MHTLVDAAGLRVDFVRSPANNGTLAFTFTERTNRFLDRQGFAESLLLGLGFDVIAVKASVDVWYDHLTDVHIEAIKAGILASDRHYAKRVAYGSSMGAYAAIRFAKSLACDRVLALSPLYDIRLEWERRWQMDVKGIKQARMMSEDYISPNCIYCFAFDPKNQDARHIALYKKIISPAMLRLIEAPYAGHPVGYFLNQIGDLKSLVVTVLVDDDVDKFCGRRYANKQQSHLYLFWLASACLQHRKPRWALALNLRAESMAPGNAEYKRQQCMIYMALGRVQEALQVGSTAIEMAPSHAAFKKYFEQVATESVSAALLST
ncbi:hypothetical protein [Aeromonas sp. R5-1]|uniref:hypothetical protein n=1 Tax=Aeromonas sp. R5-1 TaxID=3138467 RepID=UPI0034A4BEC0